MLFVFDLDFTIWDAGGTWCDHTTPPYARRDAYIEDAENRIISLFPDVLPILERLSSEGFEVAVASRTHSPSIAKALMNLFDIQKYFSFLEIYPGSKIQHFNQLQSASNIPFREMLFFDDEQRNIDEVSQLGVKAALVHDGLSWEDLNKLPLFP